MVKLQKRTIGAIAILLMLGASPLSVTYSFGDTRESQGFVNGNNSPEVTKKVQKEGLGIIITEKVVDGELKVQHYALPDDVTDEDMHRMLSVEDEISSWAYVNYKAYHSGIVLFDGKASKIGKNFWEISSNNVLNIGESQLDMKLNEKSGSPHGEKHERISDKDFSYTVIFSGKIAELNKEDGFAVFLMNSGLKNPEIGQNIKSLHIGEQP